MCQIAHQTVDKFEKSQNACPNLSDKRDLRRCSNFDVKERIPKRPVGHISAHFVYCLHYEFMSFARFGKPVFVTMMFEVLSNKILEMDSGSAFVRWVPTLNIIQ